MSDQTAPRWRTLSEDTLIPLSLVIILISGVVWISNVSSDGVHNRQDTTELEVRIRDNEKILRDVSSRLSRIEGKLDLLIDTSQK